MQIDKLNQSETMSMVNLGVYSIELPVIKLVYYSKKQKNMSFHYFHWPFQHLDQV